MTVPLDGGFSNQGKIAKQTIKGKGETELVDLVGEKVGLQN